MRIFYNVPEWQRFRKTLPSDTSLGLVATMGNLHLGHKSLFTTSVNENQFTVASLFINPTQFNNPNDFALYPRTLDADLSLMEEAGVDFCIIPDEKTMYADGFNYQIQEQQLTQILEGKHRPGHFTGVLTVVMKLLQLTQPHYAYFGEKDYQQFLLIQAMVKAFFMDVIIKVCPTIREGSGLALSSRNNRLNPEQKARAELFARLFHQEKSCQAIASDLQDQGILVEYVETYQNRRFAAVVIDGIRLIDNYSTI